MENEEVIKKCRFCNKDLEQNVHILHASTGRLASSQIKKIKRIDPVTINTTVNNEYTDVKDHSYKLCNNCWTITRIRILLLLLSPIIILLLFLLGNFGLEIQFLSDELTAIIIISLIVIFFIFGIIYARAYEPWSRLKKIAVGERGGPPYEVFAGRKENSNWILPT